MLSNEELHKILNKARKSDTTGFDEMVGYLFPNGLDAAFDALEASPSTPEQIRQERNPTEAQLEKLKAFYAITYAKAVWESETALQRQPAKPEAEIIEDDESVPDEEPLDELEPDKGETVVAPE